MASDHLVSTNKLNTFEMHIDRRDFFRHLTGALLYTDDRGKEFVVTNIVTEEFKQDGTMNPYYEFKFSSNALQTIMDDLYRLGIRPSDEVKKDDLIKVLKDEIIKRDMTINNLMDKFVYKPTPEELVKRKINI